MKNHQTIFALIFCIFLFSTLSLAQTTDKIVINGYAGWGYGKTDNNNYLLGTEEGKYANCNLALAIAANPTDRINIFSSFDMQRRKEDNVTSSSSGTQMDQIVLELNYAFAEYVFFDALRFRVGKVKAPFGLYTETYNVGTTRPFFSLPTSLYASPGLVTQSYLGIGFTGAYYFKNDWALQYDIYSGELNLQRYADFTSPMFPAIVDIKLPDMYGARIICQTAINGLDFGVSSYVGSPKFYFNGVERDYFIEGKHVVYDFHLEYLTDAISFRSEYELIGKTKGKDVKVDGYYVEAAYKFFKFWQLAVLYDQQKYKVYDPTFAEIIKLTPSTVDHSEWAFGLNYWFSPNFVLKFSYHLVEGNLFAKPQNIIQAMMSGGLEEKTNLLSVGTQFSF